MASSGAHRRSGTRRPPRPVTLALLSLVVAPLPAYAYFDPGMGSYIFQMAISGLLTVLYLARDIPPGSSGTGRCSARDGATPSCGGIPDKGSGGAGPPGCSLPRGLTAPLRGMRRRSADRPGSLPSAPDPSRRLLGPFPSLPGPAPSSPRPSGRRPGPSGCRTSSGSCPPWPRRPRRSPPASPGPAPRFRSRTRGGTRGRGTLPRTGETEPAA